MTLTSKPLRQNGYEGAKRSASPLKDRDWVAEVYGENDMASGKIVTLDHDSKVLKGNPLGDPALRKLPVYLPPNYNRRLNKRYPVVWVLSPFASWGERLLNLQPWDENIVQRADRLISNGGLEPLILAFPDCFSKYGGTQYVDSSATGRYETYLIDELIPLVDNEFRTLPSPAHRGAMGHSSGGYGALMLAMNNSDTFGAVACHSGDMMFEQCYWPDIPGAVRFWAAVGGINRFMSTFSTVHDKGKDWGSALNIVAMSACYSPNPDSPLGFDLICDTHTGEVNPAVWERWQQYDPIRSVGKHIGALRTLRKLYFDCGFRDEYNLFLGARALHQQLEHAAVPHDYLEFDGGHNRVNWRFDISLPLIASALSR